MIHYVRTPETAYLLEIYSKSESKDVPEARIRSAIEEVQTAIEEEQTNDDETAM